MRTLATLASPVLCRHCQTRQARYARGMCWTCYQDRDIRGLYPLAPMKRDAGRRGLGRENKTGALPAEPTNAQPGTEAKIVVLMARVAQGVALWHPDDEICRGD